MSARRKLLGLGLAAVLLAALFTWAWLGGEGETRVEHWVGEQLVGVLESHLRPEIRFDTLDYQAPLTVVVQNLRLITRGVTCISLERLRLELAEVPRPGRPIQVRGLFLDRPRLELVAEGGRLVGWSDLVEPAVARDPNAAPAGRRLSDVLVLRRIELRGAEIRYTERPGAEAWELPGIQLVLETSPAEAPGRYRLTGVLDRPPLLRVALDGRVNLDTGLLDLTSVRLQAALDEERYAALPPPIQRWLREHAIRGALDATGQARIPLGTPEETSGSVAAELREARFRVDGITVPVDRLELRAELPRGPVTATVAGAALLRGELAMLRVRGAEAALTRLPVGDVPLELEHLVFREPWLLLAVRPDGDFVGWDDSADVVPESADDVNDAVEAVAWLLRARRLEVHGGGADYGPAGGPLTPIRGVDVTLANEAVAGEAAQRRATGTVRQSAGLAGELDARLDTRRETLYLDRCTGTASLSASLYALLPADAARFLAEHAPSGQLAFSLSGPVPVGADADPALTVEAELQDFELAAAALRVPMRRALGTGRWPDGGLEVVFEDATAGREGAWSLTMPRGRAELTRWPSADRPTEVDRVALEGPRLTVGRGAAGAPAAASGEPDASAMTLPAIRALQVTDGAVAVLSTDGVVAAVDKITLGASLSPETPPGTARLAGRVARAGLGEGEWSVRLGPGAVQVEQATVFTKFGPALRAALPPSWREVITPHRLAGALRLDFRGELARNGPVRGELRATMRDGRMRLGEAGAGQWDQLQGTLRVPDGPLEITVDRAQFEWRRGRRIELPRATVRLPSLPEEDGPARIESLRLERPRLVWGPPEAARPPVHESPSFQDRPARGERDWLEQVRLLSAEVEDGEFAYDAGGGRPPMTLGGIWATLSMPPRAPGEYDVHAQVRCALFELDAQGTIAPRAGLLDIERFRWTGAVGAAPSTALPPQIQAFAREHELRGQLAVDGRIRLPWRSPGQATGRFRGQVTSASVTFGETHWPVEQLELSGELAAGQARGEYSARLLGGQARGSLVLDLDAPRALAASWDADGLRLEAALRAIQGGEPQYAGRLGGQGEVRWPIGGPEPISGSGTVRVQEGRLVHLPVIRQLLSAVAGSRTYRLAGTADRGAGEFVLEPDALRMTRAEVVTALINLNGKGRVYYDGRLDLDVKAGVLEKLEDQLGLVGKLVSSLTDRAMVYTVRGTLGAPEVGLKPLDLNPK